MASVGGGKSGPFCEVWALLPKEFAVDPGQLVDEIKGLLTALQKQDLVTHVE